MERKGKLLHEFLVGVLPVHGSLQGIVIEELPIDLSL